MSVTGEYLGNWREDGQRAVRRWRVIRPVTGASSEISVNEGTRNSTGVNSEGSYQSSLPRLQKKLTGPE
jgi:hypothetical protein